MVSNDEIKRKFDEKRKKIHQLDKKRIKDGKTCLACGTVNPPTAKYCKTCSTDLSSIKSAPSSNIKSKSSQGVKKQKNIFDQMKDWWNQKSSNGKASTGILACCLGLLFVTLVSGLVSPDANLAHTELTDAAAVYDDDGKYNMEIGNNTTDLVINGTTETGANVTATSSELSLNEQKVEVGSDNKFHYKVKIPANVNEVTIRFDTSAPNKDDSYIELTIKRPSSVETTSTTNTTTPATTSDSKFSGLNHPSEVESVLTQFDYDYDDRIEFLDSYSSNPDGQEEYAMWAVTAGMDPSDSPTLAYMFDKYDANGDYYWNIYDIDNFYDDYYANN